MPGTPADTPVAPCPLCAQGAARSFSKFGRDYYRCACGFVFIWARPTAEQLEALYRRHGEEYWTTQGMVSFAFSPTKSRREMASGRRFVSGGRLLDIGCSTGSFVKAATDAGFDAEGMDISRPAVDVGRSRGLKLRVANVLRDTVTGEYDIVTLWATLEYLPEPRECLHRARRCLRPGGLLFVSVPNHSGITQRLIGN